MCGITGAFSFGPDAQTAALAIVERHAVMNQPSIDHIDTWFVSKSARELGLNVAVSGLGGDELFGGYPSRKDIRRRVARLGVPARVRMLGRAVRCLLSASGFARRLPSPEAAGLPEVGQFRERPHAAPPPRYAVGGRLSHARRAPADMVPEAGLALGRRRALPDAVVRPSRAWSRCVLAGTVA
jgi:asparagine synthase (glutamine-hydrolysing)